MTGGRAAPIRPRGILPLQEPRQLRPPHCPLKEPPQLRPRTERTARQGVAVDAVLQGCQARRAMRFWRPRCVSGFAGSGLKPLLQPDFL